MKHFFVVARSFWVTTTIQHTSITFSGTAINGILGALFYFLVARVLGPDDFGYLVVSVTTLTLIADVVDFGTNTGLVRFVSAHQNDQEKAQRFLKLSLLVKLLAWSGVLLLGWILTPLLADFIFKKSDLAYPLRLAFIGVGGALLFSFVTSTLQAYERFFEWSGIQILTNFLRLVVIVILIIFVEISLGNVLTTYITIPFLGFFLGLLLLPKRFLFVDNPTLVAREFFHYNTWVAVFTLLAAFSSRLDTFIVARFLLPFEIGLYGAATQLASIIPQLVGAFGTVLAPKFASFDTKEKTINYLKKTQLLVLGIAGVGLLGIPFSIVFVPFVYGESFIASAPLFIVLLIAQLFFLISVPIHSSIFYYFSYPKFFVWLSLGHLILIGGVGWTLVSQFGALGAALTVLIGMIFNFVVPFAWVLRKLS